MTSSRLAISASFILFVLLALVIPLTARAADRVILGVNPNYLTTPGGTVTPGLNIFGFTFALPWLNTPTQATVAPKPATETGVVPTHAGKVVLPGAEPCGVLDFSCQVRNQSKGFDPFGIVVDNPEKLSAAGLAPTPVSTGDRYYWTPTTGEIWKNNEQIGNTKDQGDAQKIINIFSRESGYTYSLPVQTPAPASFAATTQQRDKEWAYISSKPSYSDPKAYTAYTETLRACAYQNSSEGCTSAQAAETWRVNGADISKAVGFSLPTPVQTAPQLLSSERPTGDSSNLTTITDAQIQKIGQDCYNNDPYNSLTNCMTQTANTVRGGILSSDVVKIQDYVQSQSGPAPTTQGEASPQGSSPALNPSNYLNRDDFMGDCREISNSFNCQNIWDERKKGIAPASESETSGNAADGIWTRGTAEAGNIGLSPIGYSEEDFMAKCIRTEAPESCAFKWNFQQIPERTGGETNTNNNADIGGPDVVAGYSYADPYAFIQTRGGVLQFNGGAIFPLRPSVPPQERAPVPGSAYRSCMGNCTYSVAECLATCGSLQDGNPRPVPPPAPVDNRACNGPDGDGCNDLAAPASGGVNAATSPTPANGGIYDMSGNFLRQREGPTAELPQTYATGWGWFDKYILQIPDKTPQQRPAPVEERNPTGPVPAPRPGVQPGEGRSMKASTEGYTTDNTVGDETLPSGGFMTAGFSSSDAGQFIKIGGQEESPANTDGTQSIMIDTSGGFVPSGISAEDFCSRGFSAFCGGATDTGSNADTYYPGATEYGAENDGDMKDAALQTESYDYYFLNNNDAGNSGIFQTTFYQPDIFDGSLFNLLQASAEPTRQFSTAEPSSNSMENQSLAASALGALVPTFIETGI